MYVPRGQLYFVNSTALDSHFSYLHEWLLACKALVLPALILC
jgi:hypothetical protein